MTDERKCDSDLIIANELDRIGVRQILTITVYFALR